MKLAKTLALAAGGAVVVAVLAAAVVAGALTGDAPGGCEAAGARELAPAGGALAEGLYAQPLRLVPGQAYEVGATEYGGPEDPSSGAFGAIPDPDQSYLPAHPDSFAELSVRSANPAAEGSFTFADADALGELPYMTAIRVWHAGHSIVLYKRDIGYGQGPGQTIANGQPYRLDVWWQAARALAVTKSAVTIELAPAGGAAATLAALPERSESASWETGGCEASEPAQSEPLPLIAGTRTRILPSGLAAAGEQAPGAVKAMVADGNRLYGTAYLYGGAHGTPLSEREDAYDCSSAVSYLLHWGGVLGEYALDSGELARYGLPGPGRYVTIYANSSHAFMYVAGLRFDTVEDPAYDSGPNSGKPGARWRVSQTVPGWSTWSVRHPAGL